MNTDLLPPDLPPMKPMARAARVSLFEREVHERLSAAAIDALLVNARVLSEGRLDCGGSAGDGARGCTFFGSTMITVELAQLENDVREPLDEVAARRLASLAAADERLLRRVRRIAEREAARVAGRRLFSITCEVRVRARDSALHVDVDVEAEPYPMLAVVRG